MSVDIDASGVADLDLYFETLPRVASEAMSRAINYAATGPALDAGRREIYAQVAYPSGYLDGDRLKVTKYATPTQLEARVTGRDRATSLARFTPPGTPVAASFAVKGPRAPNPGINVTVKPGQTRHFSSGFLIGLRNGNTGFAIRLRPGDTVREVKRYQPIQLFPGVFLLYGPSVDQVFNDVAETIAPEVTSALQEEFLRQFDVLANNS